MKQLKHLLSALLLIMTLCAHAQVGIGTATPAASAQLDVSSSTKGLLPPRMTTTQRDLIGTPAAGLIIYNTTISGLQIYSGSTWYTASAATTMGAIGGSSTTNGGTITSGVLSLAPADETNAGIVTTGAQRFAGNKTLTGTLGVGTTTPSASAKVEIASTTQGFLPPRMTGAQRNSIPGPVAGLVVFCTDCGAGVIQVYNGSFWTDLKGGAATTNNLAVGQRYQGGIIAYILQPGDPGYDASVPHGIIAAPSDQSTGIQWYNGSYVTTSATGTAIGTGNANTNTIVSVQGAGSYAAKLCSDLVLNGYSDWYLPSKDELNKLYINQALVGGFANGGYWSSTEYDGFNAWRQLFASGYQSNGGKDFTNYVRAVRAF